MLDVCDKHMQCCLRCHPSLLLALLAVACPLASARDRKVTIHTSGLGRRRTFVDPEYWPCLESGSTANFVFINHYGCHVEPNQDDSFLWLLPDGDKGPIRLAQSPDYCLDASEALAYMKHPANSTDKVTFLESVTRRLILTRRCDGTLSQQFLIRTPNWHEIGGVVSIHLASDPDFVVSAAGVALGLSHIYRDAHSVKDFVVYEHRDWHETSIFGNARLERRIVWALYASTVALLLAYIVVCVVKVARRSRQLVSLISYVLQKVGSLLVRMFLILVSCFGVIKEEGPKSNADKELKKLLVEKQVFRAQCIMSLLPHIMAIWLAHTAYRTVLNDPYHFFFGESFISFNKRHDLLENDLVPALAATIMAFAAHVRPVKHPMTLNMITIAFDILLAFRYYTMCFGMSGERIEYYLYNASWMMVVRILNHAAFGRAAVTIPCSVCLTAFDIYCLLNVTTRYTQTHALTRYYPLKQGFIVIIEGLIQLGVERTFRREVSATMKANDAYLHQKLATRLTGSLCDAVVHLDHMFRFVAPAPKLASILLRNRLGVSPTSFQDLVAKEDQTRFLQYLQAIAVMSSDEMLMPVHISLLDASTLPCRVQIVASAVEKPSSAQLVYILGVCEVSDTFSARREVNVVHHEHEPWRNYARSSQSEHDRFIYQIPELSLASHVEDVAMQSDCSGDLERQSSCSSSRSNASLCNSAAQCPMSFSITICSTSGNIMDCGEGFQNYVSATPLGYYFPAMFRDAALVWTWLQDRMVLLQDGSLEHPEERTSGPIVFDGRRGFYHAQLEIVNHWRNDSTDSSNISLTLRLYGKCGSKKQPSTRRTHRTLEGWRSPCQTAEKRGLSAMSVTGDVHISVKAATFNDAVRASIDTALSLFKHVAWLPQWWDDCRKEIKQLPYRFTGEHAWIDVSQDPEGAYVIEAIFPFDMAWKKHEPRPHTLGRASL
eukprot:TRINITY_DN23483_c0_g3_i1.p1 TRINITY_DN23483_c0_g3~~TRINITY_DN23483_c0_g3_i1.p1  ORF type:complete len:945 (+),score=48.48 TRINITY_DN23483_c0_g3_i1:50-2884(+)